MGTRSTIRKIPPSNLLHHSLLFQIDESRSGEGSSESSRVLGIGGCEEPLGFGAADHRRAREHRGKRVRARRGSLRRAPSARSRARRRATDEPGATGVASPSRCTSASPGGVQRSRRTSAWSSRRVPLEWLGGSASDSATEVTTITGSPRSRAPIAISIGTAVRPLALNTRKASGGPSVEPGEDLRGEALRALDEHRLALPVRADDLGVEGHRELDERVEAGIGAVAREELLDRDPRVAGAEDVHEPAAGDRSRRRSRAACSSASPCSSRPSAARGRRRGSAS